MTDLFLDLLHDPIGRWFLYVGVVLAMLSGAGFLVLSVRKRLRQIGEDLGLVKNEVKNNHNINMREEQDERHDENRSLLKSVDRKVDRVLGILGQHDYRLDELEHTIDPRKGNHHDQ